mgnify:CR=1 FL=1
MKTFNQTVSDFLVLSNDSSGTTLAKTLINIGTHKVLSLSDWSFLKDSKSISSGTGVQNYNPPYNMAKMEYVNYWYGGVWYTPKEIRDGETWTQLTAVSTVTSAIPQYWYISNRTHKIGLCPASTNSKGTIKMGFTKKIRDFSVSDYSTGSISASANGTIFTGTSTNWTDLMAGRFLQVSAGTTVAHGYWFEITAVGSSTSLNVKESIPSDISAGTYTISETIPLPDGFEDIPLWYALNQYYQMKLQPVLAREYGIMYKEGIQDLLMRDSRSVTGLIEKDEPISMYDVNSNPWTIGTIQ